MLREDYQLHKITSATVFAPLAHLCVVLILYRTRVSLRRFNRICFHNSQRMPPLMRHKSEIKPLLSLGDTIRLFLSAKRMRIRSNDVAGADSIDFVCDIIVMSPILNGPNLMKPE